ncbi:MAG: tetratricopeptide repeat protein [Bdellovibrionales bacterium]|nr:tetratricopeptide repeat protein [Bdellovibrionales bacterium]
MKKLLPIMLIILSSCASNPDYVSRDSVAKKRSSSSTTASEEDFSWVEKLDFNRKTEEKYRADTDEFDFSSTDESAHALVKESLYALAPAKLEESASKTEDPLIKMNVKCYQGKIDEALKIADDQYAKYKNNTSYWNQLGTCYFLKSDLAKAILFYNKSRDLDAKFIPPINNLGVVYQKQGKVQKALSAFKLAAELNTFAITPTYNLAQLYLRFGTVGKAMPIFQGLQKRSPKDVDVASALASSYLIKGEYQSAVDIYGKLDKSSLASPSVGLNYAVALKFLNRPMDAQTVLSNTTAASSGPLVEYAQKVEKFIRN